MWVDDGSLMDVEDAGRDCPVVRAAMIGKQSSGHLTRWAEKAEGSDYL